MVQRTIVRDVPQKMGVCEKRAFGPPSAQGGLVADGPKGSCNCGKEVPDDELLPQAVKGGGLILRGGQKEGGRLLSSCEEENKAEPRDEELQKEGGRDEKKLVAPGGGSSTRRTAKRL